jgi:hypothetical protein
MILFLVSILIPACIFFFVVLVKFQLEIIKASRNRHATGNVISLDRQQQMFNQTQDHNALWTSERLNREQNCGFIESHSSTPGNSLGGQAESAEIYQLESAYFGPFLIVPLRNQPNVTVACDEDHRLSFLTKA